MNFAIFLDTGEKENHHSFQEGKEVVAAYLCSKRPGVFVTGYLQSQNVRNQDQKDCIKNNIELKELCHDI